VGHSARRLHQFDRQYGCSPLTLAIRRREREGSGTGFKAGGEAARLKPHSFSLSRPGAQVHTQAVPRV